MKAIEERFPHGMREIDEANLQDIVLCALLMSKTDNVTQKITREVPHSTALKKLEELWYAKLLTNHFI